MNKNMFLPVAWEVGKIKFWEVEFEIQNRQKTGTIRGLRFVGRLRYPV